MFDMINHVLSKYSQVLLLKVHLGVEAVNNSFKNFFSTKIFFDRTMY